ncbi:hypothetical protein ACFFP0_13075 [Rhizobium puerariae]|uniref:Uncharacterized protein n=1 Tax=Rhizobium puerariae TaxID=1585791 RepID=A0ABV6AGS7_9HYPH
MPDMKTTLLAATLVLMTLPMTGRAEELPAPVHGVTFEEWASANGRLANKMDRGEVLNVLQIDDAAFEEVNEHFLRVLKNGNPAGETFRVYGTAFGDPNQGRFKNAGKPVGTKNKLATFDDYARVQGHLQAATKAGIDPQKVLDEHNLTPYEYSQEAGKWVRQLAENASKENGAEATLKWNSTIEAYEAEYTARYGRK